MESQRLAQIAKLLGYRVDYDPDWMRYTLRSPDGSCLRVIPIGGPISFTTDTNLYFIGRDLKERYQIEVKRHG